jgi:hypothetical protein
MFARLGKMFVVAALVAATGGHWAALQTVAWTAMLAGNLRTDSFAGAVSKTFDGEHPCPLCKAIDAGRKSEKKSEAVAPVLKMDFLSASEKPVLVPPARFELLPLSNSFADSLAAKPPLPPPRGFSV